MTEPTVTEAAEQYRQDKIREWTAQLRACERDGRGDLVKVCLGYIEEYQRNAPTLASILERVP